MTETDDLGARWKDAMSADVALLAAVPYRHLVEGLQTQATAGRVAYGTENAMLLAELEGRLKGQSCPVLIYPSLSPQSGPPKVRWRAIYSRQTPAVAGRHPKHDAVRPSSTDSDGDWLTFWEVVGLEQLSEADAIPMNRLRALGRKSKLPTSFVPQGPLLIENPY